MHLAEPDPTVQNFMASCRLAFCEDALHCTVSEEGQVHTGSIELSAECLTQSFSNWKSE